MTCKPHDGFKGRGFTSIRNTLAGCSLSRTCLLLFDSSNALYFGVWGWTWECGSMAMGLTPRCPNEASSTGAGEEGQTSSASACAGPRSGQEAGPCHTGGVPWGLVSLEPLTAPDPVCRGKEGSGRKSVDGSCPVPGGRPSVTCFSELLENHTPPHNESRGSCRSSGVPTN